MTGSVIVLEAEYEAHPPILKLHLPTALGIRSILTTVLSTDASVPDAWSSL